LRISALVGLALVCALAAPIAQAATVELQALLGSMAVLSIDGQRKNLRPGESHGEVTLVSTTATTVVIEINGQRRTVGMSQRVSTTYQAPTEKLVSIVRNKHDQYLTTATINGRSVQVMVDTGANVVAMSLVHAKKLGIDASKGTQGRVQTASGLVDARQIMLSSINVGGIQIDNVNASVIDSDYPVTVLLGMSYLRHVNIEESNGIMSLSKVE
jgi:aspartyl protease family protein